MLAHDVLLVSPPLLLLPSILLLPLFAISVEFRSVSGLHQLSHGPCPCAQSIFARLRSRSFRSCRNLDLVRRASSRRPFASASRACFTDDASPSMNLKANGDVRCAACISSRAAVASLKVGCSKPFVSEVLLLSGV